MLSDSGTESSAGLKVMIVTATISLGTYVVLSQGPREALKLAVTLTKRFLEMVG